MGRELSHDNDDLAYKILCHMLTLIARGQAQECLQRVLCETMSNYNLTNYNLTNNSTNISRILHKTSRLVLL